MTPARTARPAAAVRTAVQEGLVRQVSATTVDYHQEPLAWLGPVVEEARLLLERQGHQPSVASVAQEQVRPSQALPRQALTSQAPTRSQVVAGVVQSAGLLAPLLMAVAQAQQAPREPTAPLTRVAVQAVEAVGLRLEAMAAAES